MMKSLLAVAIVLSLCNLALPSLAFALCGLTITRVACPGMEDKAFAPYHGKKTTVDVIELSDKDMCTRKAEETKHIVRPGIVQKKTVMAKSDGQDLAKLESTAPCK